MLKWAALTEEIFLNPNMQHTNLSSLWNKSLVRLQLLHKSLKMCSNSSISFTLNGFIFPFLLKQLTLLQSVDAYRESSALETAGPHFSATDQTEVKQYDLLVLVSTYKSVLNSCCWARQRKNIYIWSLEDEGKAVDTCFAWRKRRVSASLWSVVNSCKVSVITSFVSFWGEMKHPCLNEANSFSMKFSWCQFLPMHYHK